jgi:hypothetical protein
VSLLLIPVDILHFVFSGAPSGELFRSFGQPYFDNGLAGNTQAPGLFIQSLDHPDGKINIYSFLDLRTEMIPWYIEFTSQESIAKMDSECTSGIAERARYFR